MVFKKGYTPWNKGLTKEIDERVAEAAKKISKALKGNKMPLSQREATRKRLLGNKYSLGHKHTDETKRKISESKMGEKNAFFGRKHSIETRNKISKSLLGNQRRKGKPSSDETRAKISKKVSGKNHPMYGKNHTKETKEKISKTRKKRIKEGKILPQKQNGYSFPTLPERTFIGICEEHKLPYIYNGQSHELVVEGRVPDFIDLSTGNIVEIFGRPFHDPDKSWFEIPYSRTEEGTIEFYKNHERRCIVIWDNEINDTELILERLGGVV